MSWPFQPLLPSGGEIIADADAAAAATWYTLGASRTTLAALQAGSLDYVLVAAIEGYPYLLTNGPTDAIVGAANGSATIGNKLSGGDWTSALGGLYADIRNEQSISPLAAFGRGGKCTLRVAPDPDQTEPDTFGIDVHKRNAGIETFLTATANRNDTSLTVTTASSFNASGTAYVGTEAIAYTGKGATSLTGCTRGAYSPVHANGSEATRFAEHHRVGFDPQAAKLQPIVSTYGRRWLGKWCSVWAVLVEGGDTFATYSNDSAANQWHCLFAGRIVEIQDEPGTGCTAIEIKHVLDCVNEARVLMDPWTAKVGDGLYLRAGMKWEMKDTSNVGTTGFAYANSLDVVSSGAAGTNRVNAGFYTADEICSFMSQWLDGELAAARIYGQYSLAISTVANEPRAKIYWEINATDSTIMTKWEMQMPRPVAAFLGYSAESWGSALASGGAYTIKDDGPGDTLHHFPGSVEPMRALVFNESSGTVGNAVGDQLPRVQYFDERGTFADQYSTLPAVYPKPSTNESREWGVFLLDGQHLFVGSVDTSNSTIRDCMPLPGYGSTTQYADLLDYAIPQSQTESTIQQVLVLTGKLKTILLQVLLSTGTSGYNDSTYDTLGYGLGVGIPASLASGLASSLDALPGADAEIVCIIREPKKFVDLFSVDMAIRFAFLRWANGTLEFKTWRTPTSAAVQYQLGESTKATPAGTQDGHRSATLETMEFSRPILRIRYNRDITGASDTGYASSVTLEDRVAVDDAGGEVQTVTLEAANTYGQHHLTGAGIESLIPGVLVNMSLFTAPARRMVRSIGPQYFEGMSVGDIIEVTDGYARDPATGVRGIAARVGVVTGHNYSLGGVTTPGARSSPMGGEITCMFFDTSNVYPYGPAADVDDTATGSGYDSGTKVLTCYASRFSEASEAADATHFDVGDKIKIIEVDPATAASPQSWDDVVAAQSGNTITLTTGLAGFDTALKYRVVFDSYADAETSQRGHTYAASASTGAPASGVAPYQYATGQAEAVYTSNTAGGLVELVPSTIDAGGETRDVGHEAALIQLVNSLLDYKLAHSSPFLMTTVADGSAASSSEWLLVHCRPIYLGGDVASNSVYRYVTLAPWLRSSDGASASVRVSICRRFPTGDSIANVDRGTVYGFAEWTTTSTTWATGADGVIAANVKNLDGTAWLYVECTTKAETRGLAKFQLGARQTV